MAEDQVAQEVMIASPIEVDDSDGADDSTSHDKGQLCHPWPHLSKYFVFKRADEANNAVFACVMCQPKTVQIKGHMSSLSNLKKHVKRVHFAMHNRMRLRRHLFKPAPGWGGGVDAA